MMTCLNPLIYSSNLRRCVFAIGVSLGLSVLAGCAGQRQHDAGIDLIQGGRVEDGLAALAQAVKEAPGNAAFRQELHLRRAAVVGQVLAEGEVCRLAGEGACAEDRFNQALRIEPSNARARAGLDGLVRDRRHAVAIDKAREALARGDADSAVAMLRPVLAENPSFAPALALKREIAELPGRQMPVEVLLRGSGKAVNFEFRDANVRQVFEALSRSSGINFTLDKDVRPDLRTSIFLRNASVVDALDLILQTSQLQKKILNGNTVLVYPGTPEKLREYQELMVKTFYLQNADARHVQNTLKTLLKVKDVIVDEKLNLVMMRDTADAVRLAEKLVAAQDLAEPEVMLDVEVMEVQRARLYEIGVQWPTQLTAVPLASGAALTLGDLRHLDGSRLAATLGKTTASLKQDLSDANLLANPRIRVRNREKAKVMVGDKIPIVTTTSTATGFVADNIQYMEVGLKVELEPDIRLQSDVAIKVALEVSSLGTQMTTPSGTVAYQIGTRNANTVLRLKDGETQILAGLLSDEERSSGIGLPGLASVPILGRLFGGRQDSRKKTEIVLAITPRLIRNLQRPDSELSEFWSGSEAMLRTRPLGLSPSRMTETTGSGASPETASAPNMTTAAAQKVRMDWIGPSQAKAGEQVTVQLRLEADGALRSLPFQATFDPAVFQVVEIVEGDFFNQEGGASSFSSNVDAVGGRFFVSAARTSTDGARGAGVVATVKLRAIAASARSDVTLLAVSPIADGGQTPSAPLPASYSLIVVP